MPDELGKLSLIGIGGSGMLPLALLLKEAGYRVQGMDSNLSDMNRSLLTENDIHIFNEETSPQLDEVQTVVVSPAVPMHHSVVRAARRRGIDVVVR